MGGKRRFKARVFQRGSGTGIEIPFDPREAFGKARAPVVVSVGEHRYRTTTFTMGGQTFVPLARKHREAAGVAAGDRVEVAMELDEAPRTVEVPEDLAAALAKSPEAQRAWERLSYTHRREHVEAILGAKRPETRARRVARAIDMLDGQ